jgi:hypothetical protein
LLLPTVYRIRYAAVSVDCSHGVCRLTQQYNFDLSMYHSDSGDMLNYIIGIQTSDAERLSGTFTALPIPNISSMRLSNLSSRLTQ